MKRLVIITDSLGAPRTVPEVVYYDDTWVRMVRDHAIKRGYDVIAHTINGLDSRELLKLVLEKLHLYDPDLVLFQYGIVDCAPRVFSEREKMLFRILQLHKVAAKIGKKYHAPLSAKRDITSVSLSEFELFVPKINEALKSNTEKPCQIINVPIGSACRGYVELSPTIEHNITEYNQVLQRNSDCYLTKFSTAPVEEIYTADCHHLNHNGHKLLAAIVTESLEVLW